MNLQFERGGNRLQRGNARFRSFQEIFEDCTVRISILLVQPYVYHLHFSSSRTKRTIFSPLRANQPHWLATRMLRRKSRKYWGAERSRSAKRCCATRQPSAESPRSFQTSEKTSTMRYPSGLVNSFCNMMS